VINVKKSKEALNLRWLQLATSTSTWKKVLKGIHIRGDNKAEASDGYRIHQGPVPEALDFDVGDTIRVNQGNTIYKSPDREYSANLVEGHFPDTDVVFPNYEPTVSIALNSDFIKDALEFPQADDNKVILEFFQKGSANLLQIRTEDDEYKALIMHMKSSQVNTAQEKKEIGQKMAELLKNKYPNLYGKLLSEI